MNPCALCAHSVCSVRSSSCQSLKICHRNQIILFISEFCQILDCSLVPPSCGHHTTVSPSRLDLHVPNDMGCKLPNQARVQRF